MFVRVTGQPPVPCLCHAWKTKQLHVYIYSLHFANHTDMLVSEFLQGNPKHWKNFKVGDQTCRNPRKHDLSPAVVLQFTCFSGVHQDDDYF